MIKQMVIYHIGDTSMSQISIGFQLGAQAFSQIIFLEDKQSYDDFTSRYFEFNAQASAVVIMIGANTKASTAGNSTGAGENRPKAKYI